jgi:hypothetical protein
MWPPPNYYTTFELRDETKQHFFVTPIDTEIIDAEGNRVDTPGLGDPEGGKRFLRYMLPKAPVVLGSVRVDGYLRSSPEVQGKLLLFASDTEVGTVDHDTGLMVIDIDLAPGLSSRRVEFVFPRPAAPAC